MSILLALSAPLSLSAALWPLVTYLKARDAAAAAERREMLQRIQAPEVAIAQAAEPVEPSHLAFDDDTAWLAYQNELTERYGG